MMIIREQDFGNRVTLNIYIYRENSEGRDCETIGLWDICFRGLCPACVVWVFIGVGRGKKEVKVVKVGGKA